MGWSMWEKFLDTKEMPYNHPSLTVPQGVEGFIIYTNVSKQGYRAILMQNDKVAAYTSMKLKMQETNYPTYELE